METIKETEINEKITSATTVILNKFRSQEQIIDAGVKMTNALADLQFALDTGYAAICTREENKDAPTAKIDRIYKSVFATEHRLKTIVKGLKNTLRNMEYGGYR